MKIKIIITGERGEGKTLIMHKLVKQLKEESFRVEQVSTAETSEAMVLTNEDQ